MRTSTPLATLAACLLLSMSSAQASHGPRRLVQVPSAFSFSLSKEDAPPTTSRAFPDLALEAGAGAGAAIVSVPLTLLFASWVGTLSPNLIAAALPSFLILAAIPPLAVTGAVWFASGFTARAGRFSPAIWATAALHVVIVVAAALLGVAAHELGDAVLFTAVEAVALPAVAVGTMHLTEPRRHPTLPLLTVRF